MRAHSSLVTRAACSSSSPHVGCVHASVVAVPTTVGALVGRAGPWPGWLQCRSDWGPLEGGVGFLHGCLHSLEGLQLVLTHWRAEKPLELIG